MELVYNIAYRPDLNGIELVWNDCKRRYRNRVDYYKANNVAFDHQALVEDIVGATTVAVAKRSAIQGEKCIKDARAIELIPNEWLAGTKMREVPLQYQPNEAMEPEGEEVQDSGG